MTDSLPNLNQIPMKTNAIKGALAVFAAMFFSANVNAQTTTTTTTGATLPEAAEAYDQGFRLGFGVSGGYVFNPDAFALGGDVRLQYDLSKFTSVTLTTGFTNIFLQGDKNDLGFIPVKAGFKGFIVGQEWYLLGEVGGAFAVTNDYDQSSMLFSPGIGYATKNIDISARYEYYSNFYNGDGDKGLSQVALRVAYGFRL